MRAHYTVLLVAAAFLANVTSVATNTLDRPLTTDAKSQRFLRIHYTEDDEERGFATVVEKGKAAFTSSNVPMKTLERWVKNNKSPKNALARLDLDNAGLRLFEKPKFKTWVDYMTLLNKQNPEAAMVTALSSRYSDDVLTQMILTAKKTANTKDLATKLQNGQMSLWKSGGKSADDVFVMLGLKGAKKNIFESPEFLAWAKYVDDLNESNPKKASLVMTSTLATQYSDEAIVKLLAAAKKVPATESIATRLEAVQPQHWLSKNTFPADAFKLFGLQADDALLANPALSSWFKYLDDFNAKNPNVKTTRAAALATNYGEDGLYQMLKAAKEVDTTEKMATSLQKAQFDNWLATKQSPQDVYRWMGVKGTRHGSAEREAFKKYLNKFNDKYVQPRAAT